MLERVLPAAVRAVETFGDPEVMLHPDEEAYVARAVPSRRREFATARHCARTALSRLGVPAAVIGRGKRGAPLWPDGVVGSITHCANYRAAAVGRSVDLVTIGIDAEPHAPLPEGVLDLVASSPEQGMLADLSVVAPEVAWDRILFSAKESVYKAWAPLTGVFLDFDGAEVSIDSAGTFVARLLVPGAGDEFCGRFLVEGGFVVTAIVCTR